MDILINTFPDEKVLDGLTFEKVKLKYGTGRSSTFSTLNGKKTSYRHGVMTEIGDIEVSVWMQIVECLIRKANETELHVQYRNIFRSSENRHRRRRELGIGKFAFRIFAAWFILPCNKFYADQTRCDCFGKGEIKCCVSLRDYCILEIHRR